MRVLCRLHLDLTGLGFSFGAAMQYFTGSKEHNVAIAHARAEDGAQAQRIRPVPRGGRSACRGRNRRRVYEALGLPWIPPELRENCGEIEAAAEGRLPQLIELARHPRRPAHAHHRDRRPRDARGNGRGRRARWLRVHRHHRPFQGARHGQRPRRGARRRFRHAGARDQSRRRSASASSPASNATSCATAPWTWPTTRWPSWTS